MSIKARFLAFDIGAESGRVVYGFLNNGLLDLKEIYRFANGPVRIFDSLYWDVLSMFNELKRGLAIYSENFGPDLDGMGFDTWGVDYALISSDNNILGFPYHYRDKRTNGIMEEAFRIIPKEEIFRITGIQFMKLNTVFQLLSMVLSKSPILDIADKMLMMPDLFNFMFTGRKVSEFTIATTSQMYDPCKMEWSKELVEKLGIPYRILPEIIPPGTEVAPLLPSIRDEIGLNDVSVIAPACHDTGSAVAAVPAEGQNWAYISSGTWSLMGVETPKPIINDKTLNYNFTNEGGVCNTFRLLKNIMGLWLVQECKRTWEAEGENLSYSDLVKLAEASKPLVSIVEPNYEPFLSHGDMPSRIRELCKNTGQPIPETKGAVVRCALESLALKYRWVTEKLEETLNKHIDVIHIVGGGCQNKLLCQLAADATQRKVIAGPIEATAIGNIMIQALARNFVKSIDEAREIIRRSFDVSVYEPRPPIGWDNAYNKYLEIMEKTVGL